MAAHQAGYRTTRYGDALVRRGGRRPSERNQSLLARQQRTYGGPVPADVRSIAIVADGASGVAAGQGGGSTPSSARAAARGEPKAYTPLSARATGRVGAAPPPFGTQALRGEPVLSSLVVKAPSPHEPDFGLAPSPQQPSPQPSMSPPQLASTPAAALAPGGVATTVSPSPPRGKPSRPPRRGGRASAPAPAAAATNGEAMARARRRSPARLRRSPEATPAGSLRTAPATGPTSVASSGYGQQATAASRGTGGASTGVAAHGLLDMRATHTSASSRGGALSDVMVAAAASANSGARSTAIRTVSPRAGGSDASAAAGQPQHAHTTSMSVSPAAARGAAPAPRDRSGGHSGAAAGGPHWSRSQTDRAGRRRTSRSPQARGSARAASAPGQGYALRHSRGGHRPDAAAAQRHGAQRQRQGQRQPQGSNGVRLGGDATLAIGVSVASGPGTSASGAISGGDAAKVAADSVPVPTPPGPSMDRRHGGRGTGGHARTHHRVQRGDHNPGTATPRPSVDVRGGEPGDSPPLRLPTSSDSAAGDAVGDPAKDAAGVAGTAGRTVLTDEVFAAAETQAQRDAEAFQRLVDARASAALTAAATAVAEAEEGGLSLPISPVKVKVSPLERPRGGQRGRRRDVGGGGGASAVATPRWGPTNRHTHTGSRRPPEADALETPLAGVYDTPTPGPGLDAALTNGVDTVMDGDDYVANGGDHNGGGGGAHSVSPGAAGVSAQESGEADYTPLTARGRLEYSGVESRLRVHAGAPGGSGDGDGFAGGAERGHAPARGRTAAAAGRAHGQRRSTHVRGLLSRKAPNPQPPRRQVWASSATKHRANMNGHRPSGSTKATGGGPGGGGGVALNGRPPNEKPLGATRAPSSLTPRARAAAALRARREASARRRTFRQALQARDAALERHRVVRGGSTADEHLGLRVQAAPTPAVSAANDQGGERQWGTAVATVPAPEDVIAGGDSDDDAAAAAEHATASKVPASAPVSRSPSRSPSSPQSPSRSPSRPRANSLPAAGAGTAASTSAGDVSITGHAIERTGPPRKATTRRNPRGRRGSSDSNTDGGSGGGRANADVLSAAEVSARQGFLSQQNIPAMCAEYGYTRAELYALFVRFKSLCALSQRPDGIDFHTFRHCVPLFQGEDELFMRRLWRLLAHPNDPTSGIAAKGAGGSARGAELERAAAGPPPSMGVSGVARWPAFLRVMAILEKGDMPARAKLLFAVYDPLGRGGIDRPCMLRFLLSSLHVAPDHNILQVATSFVDALFRDCGVEQDARITLEQAVAYMREHKRSADAFDLFGHDISRDVSRYHVPFNLEVPGVAEVGDGPATSTYVMETDVGERWGTGSSTPDGAMGSPGAGGPPTARSRHGIGIEGAIGDGAFHGYGLPEYQAAVRVVDHSPDPPAGSPGPRMPVGTPGVPGQRILSRGYGVASRAGRRPGSGSRSHSRSRSASRGGHGGASRPTSVAGARLRGAAGSGPAGVLAAVSGIAGSHNAEALMATALEIARRDIAREATARHLEMQSQASALADPEDNTLSFGGAILLDHDVGTRAGRRRRGSRGGGRGDRRGGSGNGGGAEAPVRSHTSRR